jgi:hypothetical protein
MAVLRTASATFPLAISVAWFADLRLRLGDKPAAKKGYCRQLCVARFSLGNYPFALRRASDCSHGTCQAAVPPTIGEAELHGRINRLAGRVQW